MQSSTKEAMTAILRTDPTINTSERTRLVGLLNSPEKQATEPGKICKRKEVAARVGRSTRTIDYWVKAGLLKPVKLPGHSRALGFRECDVRALVGE